MMSEESRELSDLRRDQEAAEAFKVGRGQPKRRYWVDPNEIREVDPRERD